MFVSVLFTIFYQPTDNAIITAFVSESNNVPAFVTIIYLDYKKLQHCFVVELENILFNANLRIINVQCVCRDGLFVDLHVEIKR